MEGIYLIVGKIITFLIILIMIISLLYIFWMWNIKHYTWIYQVWDYYVFRTQVKMGNFSIQDMKEIVKIFKTPNTRISNSLFCKRAIKLLENQIKNLEFDK
jgi:hypothetical protein